MAIEMRTLSGINLAAVVLLVASSAAWAAPLRGDEPDGETRSGDKAASNSPLSAPQQPGDDVSPELNQDKDEAEEKRKESLTAYMEGVVAQKEGKFQDALAAFRRASEADPKAAEPVKARALLLMRLGRVAQARNEAQKAVQLDPNDFETRIQLAVLSLADRKPADAARLIEEALNSERLDQESVEFVRIHALRGRLYIQAADAAKAAESYLVILNALEEPEKFGLDFREHQKLMNDRATGYETVGKIMLEVGRYDNAVRAFRALARVNENRPGDYHFWLALAQYRKDDLEACEKNLNLYFDSSQRSRESLRLLADLYNATSRTNETVTKLKELTVDNNEDSVELFIGELLIEQGDAAGATEVFENVIRESGNADGYLGLVQVAVLEQDPAKLLQSIRKALRARISVEELLPLQSVIANNPDFGRKVVNAAVESLKDGQSDQHPAATYFFARLADAELLDMPEQEGQLLQATLDQNPGVVLGIEVKSRLGLNQYMNDQFAEAAQTFRELLGMPGLPQGDRIMTLYRLSASAAELGEFEAAIEAVETALKLVPQNPQLMYQLGLIQLQAERYDDAEKTLRAAIQVSGPDTERQGMTRMLLGSLYTRLQRWSEAIATYQEILEMPDATPELIRQGRMALSNAYVQSGDVANGEKVLEDVYALTPEHPGVNNDLGYLYADQNKNLDQAEKMIRIAVQAEPENSAYLDSLGWVLFRRGKYEEALKALEKANSDPDYRDSTIIEHMGDVQQALKRPDDARKSWEEALKVEKESSSPDTEVLDRLNEKLKAGKATEPSP